MTSRAHQASPRRHPVTRSASAPVARARWRGFELIYDLLRAYGISNASLTRLQKGTYNRAEADDELLWKDKVYYRVVEDGEDLHAVIDAAQHDEAIAR